MSEGVGALYSGLAVTLVRDAPFSGLYLAFYSKAKSLMSNSKYPSLLWQHHWYPPENTSFNSTGNLRESDFERSLMTDDPLELRSHSIYLEYKDLNVSLIHFSSGFFAGAMASILTQPADVIKTHMQTQPLRYNSIRTTVSHVYQVSLLFTPVSTSSSWLSSPRACLLFTSISAHLPVCPHLPLP